LQQKKYNQALECQEKALELSRSLKGDQNYSTLEIYIDMADTYQKLGNHQLAEQTFSKCLDLLENKQQDDRSTSVVRPSVIHRIAITMRIKQEYSKATYLLEKVIEIK